jgi:hypothetical protein
MSSHSSNKPPWTTTDPSAGTGLSVNPQVNGEVISSAPPPNDSIAKRSGEESHDKASSESAGLYRRLASAFTGWYNRLKPGPAGEEESMPAEHGEEIPYDQDVETSGAASAFSETS